jgi:protein-S-isoprenylcysteine O-methyltransferase Ste14
VLQFLVIAAVVALGFLPPRWPGGARPPLAGIGAGLAVAGVLVALWAARLLGRGLTPFPPPRAGAELATAGPYAVVRHPIYAGGLLFFVGYALFASVAALAGTAALGAVWALKCRVEEAHLRARFPGYDAYAARVRWRLVPGLY